MNYNQNSNYINPNYINTNNIQINTLTPQEITYIKLNFSKPSQNKRYPKIIDYYTFIKNPICVCKPDEEKKFSSLSNNTNYSNNMRISQRINKSLGGSVQFGNSIEPISFNYLGKMEGMPGGGGSPPKNKF
jgi:hypothetical protein